MSILVTAARLYIHGLTICGVFKPANIKRPYLNQIRKKLVRHLDIKQDAFDLIATTQLTEDLIQE